LSTRNYPHYPHCQYVRGYGESGLDEPQESLCGERYACMELPNDVDAWTIETVLDLVKKHGFEPGLYDYKDAPLPTGDQRYREKHTDPLCRTACSLVNTSGGFILFGVVDRKKAVSPPEERVKGIPVQGTKKSRSYVQSSMCSYIR